MCLIVFAHQSHPRYRLLLAGNRDEVYARPSAPLTFWPDHPQVLGGRDLELMGTWLGITRGGRFAAVTNYREGSPPARKGPSRGHLVSDYLTGGIEPRRYLEKIAPSSDAFAGFNLLVGDTHELYYFTNRQPLIRRLKPGVHGLSNHLLNTPWPKVRRGIAGLNTVIEKGPDIAVEEVVQIFTDQRTAPDEDLPSSGVDLEWERLLSPIFITSPAYGTRSTSVLLVDRDNRITFYEQTWQPGQAKAISAGQKRYDFAVEYL